MFVLLLEALCIYSGCWVLWHLFAQSPLHDVPGPRSASLITGNLHQFYERPGLPWHFDMVKKYGRIWKFYGFFGDEQLYVTDPLALHHILIKDQYVYEETPKFIESNKLMFGDSILSTLGDHHRKQRKLLNPVFSIAHLRSLTPLFNEITHQLVETLSSFVDDGPEVLDIHHWMSQTSLEYIGQGGLGYSFDGFRTDSTNEYSSAVKELITSASALAIPRYILPFLVHLGPPEFRRFLWDLIPMHATRTIAKAVDAMYKKSREIFSSKKRALTEGDEAVMRQVAQGKDLMSILLKANALTDEKDRLPEAELLGQMSTLILAAKDTTSMALARILHTLSLRPDAQSKLREEVLEARAHTETGNLTYDELMALPYLDAVVKESLRLFAPVGSVQRVTKAPITLPLSTPLLTSSSSSVGALHLPANTTVVVGIGAVNRDPVIWGGDAEEWKPERWIGKQVEQVAGEKLPGVYSGMMTFIGGGRACIGFKFSLLETKTVLSNLLSSFIFEPAGDEVVWGIGIFAIPGVKGQESGGPCLPLRVRRARTG